MVSFAAALASHAQRWSILVTLEGHGSGETLYRYCVTRPDYASASYYRPWLASWPEVVSERATIDGGVPDAGGVSVAIVDVDDALTAAWRTDRAYTTRLNGAVAAGATSVVVDSASAISVGDVLYLGREALYVTGKLGATLNVTRAVLGTDAFAQPDDEPVYLSTPFLTGRRLRIYAVPSDGDSASDETELGTWHVDEVTLDQELGAWVLSGSSQLKYLARNIAAFAAPKATLAITWRKTMDQSLALTSTGAQEDRVALAAMLDPWGEDEAWIKVEDEIALVSTATNFLPTVIQILQNGAMGTKPGRAWEVGDAVDVIMGADPNGPSAFRADENVSPSSSRGGTFTKTANWVDIILCMLTSSAHPDDGLEMVNFNASHGNWSVLPAGWGLGVPHTLIDFDSFLDVRARTPDLLFPNFYLEPKPERFADVVTRAFLRPIGAYLVSSSGKIALRLPRLALAGEYEALSGTDPKNWNDGVVLVGKRDPGRWWPDVEARRDPTQAITSVRFRTPGPHGTKVETVFRASDFDRLAATSYYASEETEALVEMTSTRSTQSGLRGFLRRLALRKLWRQRRAPWQIALPTSLAQYARSPGDTVFLTHGDLPDSDTGTRGWTGRPLELLERELAFGPDLVGLRWRGFALGGALRFGKIAPSGSITSVASNTATLRANRYTRAASRNGWPTKDASAFEVDDVVRLVNLDGSSASGSTQVVTVISGNDVTLDGNFGGALASGKVLVFATYSEAVAQQTADRVAYAAGSTSLIASTARAWLWGDA